MFLFCFNELQEMDELDVFYVSVLVIAVVQSLESCDAAFLFGVCVYILLFNISVFGSNVYIPIYAIMQCILPSSMSLLVTGEGSSFYTRRNISRKCNVIRLCVVYPDRGHLPPSNPLL